jgi:hypothetical protein
MIAARRRVSTVKRAGVLASLEQMQRDQTPITPATVARHARVSSWLVYAPGLREAIADARTRQETHTALTSRSAHHNNQNTSALATDLALARAEIKRLRAEQDQHRHQLRRALGARLDDLAKADLVTQVDTLTQHNNQLTAQLRIHQHDNQALQTRLVELENDLAAARTSLRRMIRHDNLPAHPTDPP